MTELLPDEVPPGLEVPKRQRFPSTLGAGVEARQALAQRWPAAISPGPVQLQQEDARLKIPGEPLRRDRAKPS